MDRRVSIAAIGVLALLAATGGTAPAKLPPPTLAVSSITVAESDSGRVAAVFTIRLSRVGTIPVAVRYATQNGSALAGRDYTATRGLVSFRQGQRTRQVRVPVLGDVEPETDETFLLVLSRPRGARIRAGEGRATIGSSDLPPPFALAAELTGAEYVPQPGHPTAGGRVTLLFDPAREEVAYTISVSGMEVGESGVCRGERGAAPTALLRLGFPPQASGTVRLELTTILELFRNPERFCAQARLDQATGGIRGQLVRDAY